MTKSIAIIQSNYIPWKGYFDIIKKVDEFIIFDDMQYTRRDWRNRNKIKTPGGLLWLTIPVEVKGKFDQKIKDTIVVENNWYKEHWNSIKINYSRAAFFKKYSDLIADLYSLAGKEKYLSRINYIFIQGLCKILDIKTKISWSMDYDLIDGKTERLIGLCKSTGAGKYISGPAAKGYIDESLFQSQGIELEWMDYNGYPIYEQLYNPFEHGVTILDLLFNLGENAPQYIWGWRKK